jgi:N-acetyl-anhydromuramyl-L-alanine amidase AmpD
MMEIVRWQTPHYTPGRSGHRPRGIVIHTTVGSFLSTIRWFTDPGSGVSTHYLVGLDGRVAQFVEEADTAHHANIVSNPTTPLVVDDSPRLYTIGIEFEDRGDPHGVERTDEQYEAGAELIGEIALRWGIPLDRRHVVGHREIYDEKTCPGNLDIDRLLREAWASLEG